MHLFRKAREQGLSLKITSVLMIIISLVITVGLLASVFRTFRSFRALEQSTDDFIRFEEAAVDLMSASDYLTDEVQCYTVIRDRSHLENYFNEADVLRRREKAIDVIQSGMPDSPALVRLTRGMEESVRLMDREFYAMRLILEAAGDPDIPKVLQEIRLSAADKALTPDEQIALAQRMVHDADYYARKDLISRSMNECIQELKSATWQTQQAMDADTRRDLFLLTVLILIQAMATFITAWLTTHLGVNPVLQAVDSIRRDQQLPIVGASEFRYLAGTYNVMYCAYKKSIENLNFRASHDELTGAYNRAGYDLIKSSLNLGTTAMLLFDADNYKQINDTYGHDMGDAVLRSIADTLRRHFRSDDYICRIGGDEFVVFMVHLSRTPHALIEEKILSINRDLSADPGGLPAVTMSAGVSFSPENQDPDEMFRQADLALYYVKEHGRSGCCFYHHSLPGKARPAPKPGPEAAD